MARLILAVPDLNPARLSPEASALLPRLPALEQWLARAGAQRVAGGWRRWLQRELGGPGLSASSPASIGATAVPGLPPGQSRWFATPAHLVAGLDTVRVHPEGLLRLGIAEQRTLEQDFARVFAGAGCSLHATGRRELLLALADPLGVAAVRSEDPALWLGADPRGGLPSGPGAGALRRLGSEIELWLHQHAVNEARAARGELGANALWIWGGGAPIEAAASGRIERRDAGAGECWADDLYVDGLARHLGWTVHPPPASWTVAGSAGKVAADGPTGVQLVVRELGAAGGASPLARLEEEWVAPLLAQWRRGHFDELILLAGERAFTLRRASWLRAWRRFRAARPWWEGLQAC